MSAHGSFDCRIVSPLPSSGSDLNLDGWSFRPNLEPSCHIGGRWTAFLPPPCRRKPSLSSMKTGEAWENPLVWVPPHLACPSLKEESRRVALCPQYLPLPGNPPPLAFLPQDRVGRCDGTQDWSLHSQQGVTDCRAEQSGEQQQSKVDAAYTVRRPRLPPVGPAGQIRDEWHAPIHFNSSNATNVILSPLNQTTW